VLELGSGEGRVVRDLNALGYDVIGMDPSPTLVRHAHTADRDGTYLVGQGEALPFPNSAFDLVVAYNSLQNVSDLRRTVSEAGRVLKPGGQFCVCIAHPMTDAGRFQSPDPSAPFVINTSYYGPRRVGDTVERAGLQITFHGWAYSLQEYANAFTDNGFVLDLIHEPRPTDEVVARRPGLAQWQRLPLFLFVRATKRADPSG